MGQALRTGVETTTGEKGWTARSEAQVSRGFVRVT
jgi:hypothetical protein